MLTLFCTNYFSFVVVKAMTYDRIVALGCLLLPPGTLSEFLQAGIGLADPFGDLPIESSLMTDNY